MLTEAEGWEPGQLSVWKSLGKPKQHYTVCNELGLLLEVEVGGAEHSGREGS